MKGTVEIGGKKYTIEPLDTEKEPENLGHCYTATGIIRVADKTNGDTRPADAKMTTLWHELLHCMLHDAGYYGADN